MGYVGKVQDTAGNTHLVGSTLYGTCSTATATAAKVVTCSDYVEEVEGVTIHIHFTNKNTAGCTLNVNSKGAHTCVGCDGIPGSWEDDSVASFTLVKDGNTFYWYQNNLYWEGGSDTKVTQTATTTNSDYPILFKNSANQTAETSSVRYAQQVGANRVPSVNPSNGCIYGTGFNDIGIEYQSGGSAGIHIYDDDSGTALIIPDSADYTLGPACELGVDSSIPSSGWSSVNVPTTAAVANYVASAISGGNAFMGSLVASGGNGSTTWTDAQVQASSYTRGQYWVCSAAGTYCGNVLEAGDMLFCVNDKASAYSASDFSAVQNNIETLTTTEVSNLWTAAVAVS